MSSQWFSTWFDSEYYHLLYKNRNDDEAQLFINNIVAYLALPKNSTVLDLACGKGRHSIMLNKLGLDVVGVDLSENSIAFTKQFENETLHFFTHDMRKQIGANCFNAVFNCFTSFGYFNSLHQNQLVANAMVNATNIGGKIIVDFINTNFAEALIAKQSNFIIQDNDVTFTINKKIENGFIIKTIDVQDGNKPILHFMESVQVLKLNQFIDIFKKAGASLETYFGNYNLDAFDAQHSPRLIMVFVKL